ncbi:hypothetical protein D3C72_1713120 [compost metagenome]
MLKGIAQALVFEQCAIHSHVLSCVTVFAVTDVVAAPGAGEPLAQRHTQAERNHLVIFTVVGFTVGVRQMVTDAFHNGIQSG